MKRDFIHTSESVTEGHPDKVCDQISDAIIDRFLEHDFCARVTAECAVSLSVVFISARFASKAKVDFTHVARKVIRRIGYVDPDFDFRTCSILTSLKEMAPQDRGLSEEALCREELPEIPVDDQVTLFGFACNQTPTFMPLPIYLAHKLSRRLAHVRLQSILPYLSPDGTTQVAVEFKDRRPSRIHSIAVNTSQTDRSFPTPDRLRDDIMENVVDFAFLDEPIAPDPQTRIFVNPGGPLRLGGPAVHSGLTGRKNAIDTYGGFARHSGSALSGKDPMRIDRVGAYMARYVAKNVVAAGLADQCEVQVSYTIGLTKPASIQIETMGTGIIPDEEIARRVRRHFDFSLTGILSEFNLRKIPSLTKGGFYRRLAAYGHFGRTDFDVPWERTDNADILKEK